MTRAPECPGFVDGPPLGKWQLWSRICRWFAMQHQWDEPWGSVTCVRCGTRAYVEYGR